MTLAHKRRAAAVLAVAVLLGVVGALRVALPVDADVMRFLPGDKPAVQGFDTLVERLRARDVVLVGVESSDDDGLFTAARLRYLQALGEAIAARPEVEHVTALSTLAVIETKDGESAHVALIPPTIPEDPAALTALRTRVLAQDYLASLVSADGGAALMVLQLAHAPTSAVAPHASQANDTTDQTDATPDEGTPAERVRAAALAVPAPPGTALHFGGAPFIEAAGPALTNVDLRMLGPGMGIALLTLIALVMRSLRGMVIVVKASAVATLIALGALSWAGVHASLVASSLPLVVLFVAIACAVALELGAGRWAILRGGGAAVAACVAWQLMSSAPLRELGALLAIAIAIAVGVVVLVAPALAVIWPPRARSSRPVLLPFGGRVPAMVVAVVVAAGCATQIPRLEPQTDIHQDFPAGSAEAEADRFLARRFGGYFTLQVLVSGDMQDPRVIERLAAFEDLLWAVPGVVRVESLSQVLAVVHEGLEGTRREPETRAEAEHLGFLARANDPATQLLVDDASRTTVLQVAIAADSKALEARVSELAAALGRGETPDRATRLIALAGRDASGVPAVAAALTAPLGASELTAARTAIATALAHDIGEDEMIALRDDGALSRLQSAVADAALGAGAHGIAPDAFAALLRHEAAADELADAKSFDKAARYLHARVSEALAMPLDAALASRLAPLLTAPAVPAPASAPPAPSDPRITSLRAQRIAATIAEQLRAAPDPTPAASDIAAAPLSVTVTGEPMIMRELGDSVASDLALGLGVGLVFAALVLLASSRSAPRVLLALVPVVAALIGAAGLMGASGFPINLTTPVVVALALALGMIFGSVALGDGLAAMPNVERLAIPAGALLVLAFAAFAPVHRLGLLAVATVTLAALAAKLIAPSRPLPASTSPSETPPT